jgi:hypothetical protein
MAEMQTESTSGSTSWPIRSETPAAESKGESRPLRNSVRPADPVSQAAARGSAPGGARISKAGAQHGGNGAFNPAFDSTGLTGNVDSLSAAALNAPGLRELSEYARERQISASQHSVAAGSDPFAALDQEHAGPPGTWIHAGAHHAEAGYLDPALGWIGVRADAAATGVHAALVPASAEHHREAATVTMTAPQDGREGMGAGSGSGDRPSAGQRDPQTSQSRNEGPGHVEFSQRGAVSAVGMSTLRGSSGVGKHISVMA